MSYRLRRALFMALVHDTLFFLGSLICAIGTAIWIYQRETAEPLPSGGSLDGVQTLPFGPIGWLILALSLGMLVYSVYKHLR